MIITLDNLASRYNCLPSEALEKATTFDLYVLDTSAKWDRHKHNQDNPNPGPKEPPKLSQEQLMALLKKTKDKHND